MINYPNWPCSYVSKPKNNQDVILDNSNKMSDSSLDELLADLFKNSVQPTLFDDLINQDQEEINPFQRLERIINDSIITSETEYIEHTLHLTHEEVKNYIDSAPTSLEDACEKYGINPDGILVLSLGTAVDDLDFPFVNSEPVYSLTMRKTVSSVFASKIEKGAMIIGGIDLDDNGNLLKSLTYDKYGKIPFPKDVQIV